VGTLMLALGDSIAAGIGAPHASDGCMALLAAWLGHIDGDRPSLRLANLAVPGESAETMLAPGGQLERAEELIAAALGGGDMVAPITLSIGGNDALVRPVHADSSARAALRGNLDRILDRLAAAVAPSGRAVAEVACIQTVYNPFANHAAPVTLVGDAVPPPSGRGLNAVIRAAAARLDLRVAEVSHAFRGRAVELTWIASGDIHPTEAGHRLIAETYLAAGGWARR
jgi:lysophospholipase L1-like esterase